MKKERKQIKVMTSQIKKGDVIKMGNQTLVAESDAYEHNGTWSIDIYDDLRYGFYSQNKEITVERY